MPIFPNVAALILADMEIGQNALSFFISGDTIFIRRKIL